MATTTATQLVTAKRTRGVVSWHKAFLSSLEETGVILRACKAANVSRKTVWQHRQDDPEFAKAFEASALTGALLLEAEAIRRAKDGVVRMKFNSKTGLPFIDPRTKKPYMEHEYSDTLMCLLLKRHFPDEYREKDRGDIHVSSTTNNFLIVTEAERLDMIEQRKRLQDANGAA